MDYAEKVGASVIVRGLRAISDFEYEFQMALMNRRLNPRIETVFMMPAESYSYLSSRLVKEVFQLGGRVSDLVPPVVERRLREKYGDARAAASRLRTADATAGAEDEPMTKTAPVTDLSRRVRSLEVSPTVAMAQRAAALQGARARRVLDFSVGEPDQPTPAHIARRGQGRARRRAARATRPPPACPSCARPWPPRYRKDFGVTSRRRRSRSRSGGKQALYLACQALLDRGDEVIIPSPALADVRARRCAWPGRRRCSWPRTGEGRLPDHARA